MIRRREFIAGLGGAAARIHLRLGRGRPSTHKKTRPEGVSGRVRTGRRFGGTPIRYLIMGDAAVDSSARSHKRIVDNLTHADQRYRTDTSAPLPSMAGKVSDRYLRDILRNSLE